MFDQVTVFFRWWQGELKGIFSAGRCVLALDLTEDRIVLLKRSRRGWKPLAFVNHTSDDWQGQMAAMKNTALKNAPWFERMLRIKKPRVELLLPPEQTLISQEVFPAEAAYNLHEVALWRIENLVPYTRDEIAHDVMPISRTKKGDLLALIAATPRKTVSEAIDYAEKWGFSPQIVSARTTIRVIGKGAQAGPVFSRISSGVKRQTTLLRRISIGLSAVIVFGCMFIGLQTVARKVEYANILEQERLLVATKLVTVQQNLSASTALINAVFAPRERRDQEQYILDILENLSTALPNNVYAKDIRLANGVLRIEGVAARANEALEAIDAAASFELARFVAPVTPLRAGQYGERFIIEADILAQPKLMP